MMDIYKGKPSHKNDLTTNVLFISASLESWKKLSREEILRAFTPERAKSSWQIRDT